MNDDHARWRGLQALVTEAVENGSRAVERIQLESARRPFAIIEQIPKVAKVAKLVHAGYALSVTTTHEVLRVVNRAAGATAAQAIDLLVPPRR